MAPLNYSTPPPAHSQTPHSFPLPLLTSSRRHEDNSNNLDVISPRSAASGGSDSHSIGSNNIDHNHGNHMREQEQSLSLSLTPVSQQEDSQNISSGGNNRGGLRMRGRRGRGRNRDRSHQRQLSEMSVRGLDLLRMLRYPRPEHTAVLNVIAYKLQRISKINIASNVMPFCTTKVQLVKSFHVLYAKKSFQGLIR